MVLTTHYMEEAEALCERLAIIDHGKILVCDTPQNLKSSIGAQTVIHLKLSGESDPRLAAVSAPPRRKESRIRRRRPSASS